MIVTKLQGGLGNQMFQWAYARSLAEIFKRPYFFDASFYANQPGITPRKYALDKFPYLKESFSEKPVNAVIVRDDFHFAELLVEPGKNYYLDGYFQSENYFINNKEIIKEELKMTDEIKTKLFQKYPQLNSKTISLHVRRTDFIKYNEFHPVQPVEYYETAIGIIGGYDCIFIFSDDIEWCKENLTFERMIFIDKQEDVEDLWMMSLCQHNIIANSSFSWWGAWLNENPFKKVVAPRLWFGDQLRLSSKDIIPENWIVI